MVHIGEHTVPDVSIIIPTFNSEKYIAETLDCLIRQSFKNWEAIIVDDFSSDGTLIAVADYASADCRFQLIVRPEGRKGGSACRNIGLENSKGKYVIFLDSDDILDESCLQTRVSIMESESLLNFGVFMMKKFFVAPGDSHELTSNFHVEDPLYSFLSNSLPWTITSPIWVRSFLIKLNGFDERYVRLQDPEIHTRALLVEGVRYRVFFDHPADCYYRQSTRGRRSTELIKGIFESYRLYIEDMYSVIQSSCLPNKPFYTTALRLRVLGVLSFVEDEVGLLKHYLRILNFAKLKGIISLREQIFGIARFFYRTMIANKRLLTWNNGAKYSGF